MESDKIREKDNTDSNIHTVWSLIPQIPHATMYS